MTGTAVFGGVHLRRGTLLVPDCLQANKVGVEESLMLDPHGFVATCNSVNFFIVRKGEVRQCSSSETFT